MRHAYSRSYNLVPIGLSLSWTSTSMSLTYKGPIICLGAILANPARILKQGWSPDRTG
ncbi:MAG: hypothetical protein OJF51_000223 [Nitrospira sp.]|nr:MAG: hypothetical protein OJF51_000223 [Nitrospira sp.]